MVDYSTAFTGIAMLVSSRLSPGSAPLLAWIAVPFMMVGLINQYLSCLLISIYVIQVTPGILSFLVSGCEGHIASIQPAYKTFVSTGAFILKCF